MGTTTAQRFSAVQKAMAASGIAKSERNTHQKYQYRGIDQLMNALAPALAANEVLILSSVRNHSMEQLQKGTRHVVTVDFTVVGPEGELGPFSGMGECVDFGDKGLNKAIGAAFKYWAFTSLCIPTEATADEADAHSPEVQPQTINETDLGELTKLIAEVEADVNGLLKYFGVNRLADLPVNQYATAIEMLNKKKQKMAKEYAEGEAMTAQSIDQEVEAQS